MNMASSFTKIKQQPPGINMESSSSSKIYPGFRPGKKLTNPSIPEQEKVKKVLTPEQKQVKDSVHAIGLNSLKKKVIREAEKGKTEPVPKASVTGENALAFGVAVATNVSTAIGETVKYGMKEFPNQIMKIADELKTQANEPVASEQFNGLSITKKPLIERPMKTNSMTGGGMIPSKADVKDRFNKMLFMTLYLPGILTLFAFFFLLFYLLCTFIQWVRNEISNALGSEKKTLPTITFNKKTTQTIYSIFFVITSWFLMFILFIDYFRKLEADLHIVQIFKQLIGASYILWPMSVLIIGSGISKAFYKISCNGNKPNVLSWAKIVESSALYVLGICVLITLLLLFKPVVWIYKRFPQILKYKFIKVENLLSMTLKLMVIYIVLRMVTVMLEDIISNRIVFFISKFNKDIEAPSVDCNVEEKKTAKQSEIARILEEIYMYISGIIVCIIAIFILVIQCPHPYMASTSKINHAIAGFILKLTGIATRFILQNKDRQVDSGNKKTGPGSGLDFSSILSGNNNEVAPSDSTTDAYSSKIAATDNAGDAAQAAAQAAYTNKINASAASYTSTAPPSAKAPTPPSESLNINPPGLTPEMMDRNHFSALETAVPETTAPATILPPATTTSTTRLTPIEGIKPNQISTLNTRVPLNPIPKKQIFQ
jgi:hypothetical protein